MSELLVIAPVGISNADKDNSPSWWLVDREGNSSSGDLPAIAERVGDDPVIVVLSAGDALVSRVSLARKQARHIAKVVPFLLEDQLLAAPESQWFSWGDGHDGQYPVVAVDRGALTALLERLRSAGLSPRSLRIDALELADLAPVQVTLDDGQTLLLTSDATALVVPTDQADLFTSEASAIGSVETTLDGSAYRQALHAKSGNKPVVELLHGPFRVRQQPKARQAKPVDAAWRRFAGFAAAAVVCGLLLVAFQGWQYRQAADSLRQQANAAYQDLFPGDRATPKLERQFQRRLEMSGGSGASGGFLAIINPVGEALGSLRDRGITPRSIQYSERDGDLVLELSAPDYELLQSLQSDLESRGLVAEIANYRNQGEKVSALLRVQGS